MAKRGPYSRYTKYTPEQRARAIDLACRAVSRGWSMARFCRRSGVGQGTLLEWLSADDDAFERYAHAMASKAMLIPDLAMNVVEYVLNGRAVLRPDPDRPGEFVRVVEKLEPKAAGVVLRHLEFRMQREIKKIYEPTRTVKHKHSLDDMPDQEVERRYNELMERERQAGLLPPPRKEKPDPLG